MTTASPITPMYGLEEAATIEAQSNIESLRASIPDNQTLQTSNPSNEKVDLESGNELAQKDNIVDWDGPDDPKNPRNWSQTRKMLNISFVSAMSLLVNLGTTIFAPGAPRLIKEFGVTNEMIETLTVSIYLLGFGTGPFILSPLSEYYGRLPVYHVSLTLFCGFTLGCGFSPNISVFLALRYLAGFAGSAPLTLGGGSIADIVPQEKRGTAMAFYAMGPLLGPIIGPVAGGFIAQNIGWRWTFHIMAIASSIIMILAFIFMRESYAQILLQRKTAQLRKETGNEQLKSKLETNTNPKRLFINSIIRPFKILFLSPIVLLFSTFTALFTGVAFLLFTTFPYVFEEQYGFSTSLSGLAYLGLGIGCLLGVVIFSRFSDRILKKLSGDGPMKPEYRLPLMVMFTPIIPVGLFWYGWSAYYRTHWIVPILGTFCIGLGVLFVVMPVSSYFVDIYGPYAASALAANTAFRSLGGTFFPLTGPALYDKLGLGWGNTVIGFITLAMAGIPLLFYKYGERIRTRWQIEL